MLLKGLLGSFIVILCFTYWEMGWRRVWQMWVKHIPLHVHLQSILTVRRCKLYFFPNCSLYLRSLFHCISLLGFLWMPCTQSSCMFSHLGRTAGEVNMFQVIPYTIHSRVTADRCVMAFWIPDWTTYLGSEPAYAPSAWRLIVFSVTTLN